MERNGLVWALTASDRNKTTEGKERQSVKKRESEKVLATKHKSNTGKNEEKGPAILMLRKMKKNWKR